MSTTQALQEKIDGLVAAVASLIERQHTRDAATTAQMADLQTQLAALTNPVPDSTIEQLQSLTDQVNAA